jgi:hypothetical protein
VSDQPPDPSDERGTRFAWLSPEDIEDMDDLAVIDGRLHWVHPDGTCCPLLRQIVLADSLPGQVEPEVAATAYFKEETK